MYYASDNGYFSSISSKVQFTDEEILKYVSEKFGAYKDKCISNGVHNYIYNGRGSVTNYKVGFRQNGVTHYRRIQLTDSDANKLASLLKKDENFVKAYMELPDSDKISVNYITGNMEDSDCKDIYETIKSEIKQIGFEKWYQIVTSDADTFLMSVRFSKMALLMIWFFQSVRICHNLIISILVYGMNMPLRIMKRAWNNERHFKAVFK